MRNLVIAGLVPAIPISDAHDCPPKRDGRDIGERSDAVLRTAMSGHDGLKIIRTTQMIFISAP
jgi:hypothetical protein